MSESSTSLQELKALRPYFESDDGTVEKATALDIGGKDIKAVPAGIFELTGLVELGLQNNYLSTLPPEISLLTGLTSLNIGNNPIEQLPPQITALTNLQRLWTHNGCGEINIKKTPRGITSLPCYTNTDKPWSWIPFSTSEALQKVELYDE